MAYTTIDDPGLHFNTILYTGNGGTNAITGVGFQPDFTWLKKRNGVKGHKLFDSVRGVTKIVQSSADSAEETNTTSLTAFGADGFTLGAATATNSSSDTFVSWNWKESATAGFDIVTYTGNGTAGNTVSHSLGVKPNLIFTKKISASAMWGVYESHSGADYYMNLDDTIGAGDNATIWNDTEPTTSVFSLGTHAYTNTNTATYVAYLWRSVQGFSKFGSYEGAGATTDNTFVYLGFKPAMIIVKAIDTDNQWNIFDNKRNTGNPMDKRVWADSTDAESTYASFDFLAQGFKVRNTSVGIGTADTFIYMAFAEAPFVNSNGVPCTAR